jgi:hypothetical protein
MPMFKLSIWTCPINLLNQPPYRWAFRPSKYLLKGIHVHSMGVQGLSIFLKGAHAYSIAFRGCSILTKRCSGTLNRVQGMFTLRWRCSCTLNRIRSCSILTQMHFLLWSHHSESHSIMTQWCPCALNGCSHSLNGIHVHSMVFRGYSHSLIGIHAHSMGIQGLLTITQRCSHALNSVQWCLIFTQMHPACSYT